MIRLTDVIRPECIRIPLTSRTVREAIDELCSILADADRIPDPQELAKAVLSNEGLTFNVPVPGIAIPHAKSRLVGRRAVVIGRFQAPIDWAREQPVHHVFLVVGPENADTADLVLGLQLVLRDTRFVERLRRCSAPEEVHHCLTHAGIDLDVPRGLTLEQVIDAEQYDIRRLAWAPDGRLASIGRAKNNPLCIWDVEKGSRITRLPSHPLPLYGVAWSPDGRYLATSADEKNVRIWSAKDYSLLRQLETNDIIHDLAWSPDGTLLAVAGHIRGVRVWSESGQREPIADGERLAPPVCLDWPMRADRFAAVGGRLTQYISVWERGRSGALHQEELESSTVFALALSPALDLLAVGLQNGVVLLYDVNSWKKTRLSAHSDQITSVSFSPGGELLASKSLDGSARLWRTSDWALMADFLDPTTEVEETAPLAFSPVDGRLATLGGQGDLIRVWRIERERLVPDPHVISVGASAVRLPRSLVGAVQRGEAFLFAGAGMSHEQIMKSGSDVRGDIVRAMDQDYRNYAYEADKLSFEEVMEDYASINGVAALQQRLARSIAQDATPASSHCIAVSLFRVIVTTNWDLLFERACADAGLPCEAVVRDGPHGFSSAYTERERACQILKLHGSIADPASLVATATQFDAYHIEHPHLYRAVSEMLHSRTAVFVGYGMREPHLRRLLATVRAAMGEQAGRHYVVGTFSDVKAESLSRRGFRVLQCSSERFFDELGSAISY